jgi:hypothetical protein
MLTKKISSAIMLIAVLTVSLISGCKKSTYYELTDEDMTWLVYKNYEVDNFYNSQNEKLSYSVILRSKSYHHEGDTYSEYTSALFGLQNDTIVTTQQDGKGELLIQKYEGILSVTFSWPHFTLKGIPLHNRTFTTATIGGVIYEDIMVIDGAPLATASNYVTRIWYSKSTGVVQLEDINNELWVRDI